MFSGELLRSSPIPSSNTIDENIPEFTGWFQQGYITDIRSTKNAQFQGTCLFLQLFCIATNERPETCEQSHLEHIRTRIIDVSDERVKVELQSVDNR